MPATMGPWIILRTICSAAQLSTVLQILLYLPLTLAVLGQPAFLANSLLLFGHSLIHGTLALLTSHSPWLSVLQTPMHPFLLLLSFNMFSTTNAVSPWVSSAASWWGTVLRFSSPGAIVLEGLSSLLVAQKFGQVGKDLVGTGREDFQIGLLVLSAAAYVGASYWLVQTYTAVASSPLSSTLLGVALTAFVFLTFIGFAQKKTNVIESSALALVLAYNVWLCGFDKRAFSDPASSYATTHNPLGPLLDNIMPHLQTLVGFITHTLPKPVVVALIFRLGVLQAASRILPTIGTDPWEHPGEGEEEDWSEMRPTTKLTRFLLTYRQAVFVTAYSHLLLLDHSSQVWWRWTNVFFTLGLWAVELLVTGEDDITGTKWKVE